MKQPIVREQIVVAVRVARDGDDLDDSLAYRLELRLAELVRARLRVHARSI